MRFGWLGSETQKFQVDKLVWVRPFEPPYFNGSGGSVVGPRNLKYVNLFGFGLLSRGILMVRVARNPKFQVCKLISRTGAQKLQVHKLVWVRFLEPSYFNGPGGWEPKISST